jgi:hypothetical protein
LSARCDEDTAVGLHATITLLSNTGSRRAEVFRLAEPRVWLKAGRAHRMAIQLPAPALIALKHGSRETAALVLNARSAGGTARVKLRVLALKL